MGLAGLRPGPFNKEDIVRVKLSKHQAAYLLLHEHEEFVRAAFYLGFSVLMIREHVRNPSMEGERNRTVDVALRLGMNSSDTVEVL